MKLTIGVSQNATESDSASFRNLIVPNFRSIVKTHIRFRNYKLGWCFTVNTPRTI